MSFEDGEKKPIAVGGQGGCGWDDGVHSTVRQLVIAHGNGGINSIQIEYDKTGTSIWSEKHGGNDGDKTDMVKLDYPDEYLASISGHYGRYDETGPVIILSLILQSSRRTYGPFGVEQGTQFSIPTTGAKIAGFYGKSGSCLDAIGIHLKTAQRRIANANCTVLEWKVKPAKHYLSDSEADVDDAIHNISYSEEVMFGPEITRTKGDVPPAHYTLKIDTFSELSEILKTNGLDKYESGVFEVDGNKWKLVLYPSGNEQRNGNGHISLYLALVATNAILPQHPLLVTLKFFIHDQIRDKYLTIQDWRVRRYNALKTEHGFHQLLPLNIFTDSSSGYLDNDCCTFGAEVHVSKFASKGEKIKIFKEPPICTFTWVIDKFSTLESKQYSQVFAFAGYNWFLELYPKGDLREKARSLSIFLNLDLSSAYPGSSVYVEYKLLVKDQVNGKHQKGTGTKWFSNSANFSGFSSFLMLRFLDSESHGFLVKDTLVVEVQFNIISVVKYLP